MAIFSRRDIQIALDGLAGSVSPRQLEILVNKLNRLDPDEILATIWEVVILSAFRRLGKIEYERNFGGQSRLDLFFQGDQAEKLEFCADITTVSDSYIHKTNAYEEFCSAIYRFLKNRNHIGAGLYIDVAHEKIGKYGDSKIRILLPKRAEINQFVKSELNLFLSQIAREPDKDTAISYNKKGICFSIKYNSKEKRFNSGRCIVYTVPYSRRYNPLENALRKKAKQLTKSGYTGSKGLIVCDGNCEALKERHPVAGMHGCSEIVEPFLRLHKSISFVLVLRIEEHLRSFHRGRSFQFAAKLYWNFSNGRGSFDRTKSMIDEMLNNLPSPESTADGALRWLGRNKNTGRMLGEISMKGDTIKISARSLTELLAGKIELEQFLKEHNFKPMEKGHRAFPFFEMQLQKGNALKNSHIEPAGHKDDDWIVLEYDGPDSAISDYRVSNVRK